MQRISFFVEVTTPQNTKRVKQCTGIESIESIIRAIAEDEKTIGSLIWKSVTHYFGFCNSKLFCAWFLLKSHICWLCNFLIVISNETMKPDLLLYLIYRSVRWVGRKIIHILLSSSESLLQLFKSILWPERDIFQTEFQSQKRERIRTSSRKSRLRNLARQNHLVKTNLRVDWLACSFSDWPLKRYAICDVDERCEFSSKASK